MFKLFRIKDTTLQPIQVAPEWSYIKTTMNINVQRVKRHYRNTIARVPNQHFLVRLLESIPVPVSLDLDNYYRAVNSTALGLANSMQMTTAHYRGRFFTGVAYGDQSHECLLTVDDTFSYAKVATNWEDAVAVKPIMHDKTDMSLLIPNSVSYSSERSNAVLLLNLPMLAVQYRSFCHAYPDENANNFVAQYVLPNMLESHLELCFINRLMMRFYDKQSTPSFYAKHPFGLVNLDSQIDTVIDKLLGYIASAPRRFDLILKTIPSFTKESAYDVLLMPDIPVTKQVHWASIWSRLKYMAFLFDVSEEYVFTTNQSEINEIIMELNYGDIYNTFRNNMPMDLFFKAQRYLEVIDDRF